MKKILFVFLGFFTAFSAYALSGKEVYEQTCIACHGANGEGVVKGAANFTAKDGPLTSSDTVLLEHIINGYKTPASPIAMPPRGGNPKLTDDELKSALQYIREKFQPK